jgi:HEPN superfamily Apea-like protein/ApeA-like protein
VIDTLKRRTILKEDISFRIESKNKLNIKEFNILRRKIDILFSLGYRDAIYPSSILYHVDENKTVKLVKSEFISEESFFNFKYPNEMLFTFSDIKDRFGDIVSNLLSRSEEIETIYNLYLRVVYEPIMNPIFRFLTLAHAVEAYHRITSKVNDGKYLKDSDYEDIEAKLNELIEELSDDNVFKESMKGRIKYGNEFSLRKRLKILFKKYSELFDILKEKQNKLIDDIVLKRNYYTHYDEKDRKKTKSGTELYYLSLILKVILEICLLEEFGFSLEEIKSNFFEKWKNDISIVKSQIQ